MEYLYKILEVDLVDERLIVGGFFFGGQLFWKVFWLFFVVGFLLFSVVVRQVMVVIVDLLMQEVFGEYVVVLILWGMVGVELVRLVYLCFSFVVVWCCGCNFCWVVVCYVSRVVLLVLIFLIFYLIYLVWVLFVSF